MHLIITLLYIREIIYYLKIIYLLYFMLYTCSYKYQIFIIYEMAMYAFLNVTFVFSVKKQECFQASHTRTHMDKHAYTQRGISTNFLYER